MPCIQTISPEQSEGRLKEIYDHVLKSRGKIAEVHKIQSLNPDALASHMDLYLTLMFGTSPLKRYQREMIGVVVSCTNHCEYCINHHEQALLAYWKDKTRTRLLITDFRQLHLKETDRLLCEMAVQLTKYPSKENEHLIRKLRKTGLDDRSLLDAVQIVAYFNFVNRLVLGLNVKHTPDEMKGYNY